MEETKQQFPTEEVTLPSKGLLYPKESPLNKGNIEMKYMTAKEEDILTNTNFIKNGTVLDKLLESLIITKNIKFNDLLVGDKNALLIAARILGYGPDYEIRKTHPETGVESIAKIDLTKIKDKIIDSKLIKDNTNEFEFSLPTTKKLITFKFLTHGDEKKIDQELKGLEKLNKQSSEGTTKLKHLILSIDGNYETKVIRKFIDNELLARDARALRLYMKKIGPDINLKTDIEYNDGYIEYDTSFPMNPNFFWPDVEL
tara:strand:- start:134 stop:904 length:771 start_codon:yes stop_codon:yes gene_type:complete